MILTIDIGNSEITLGCFKSDRLIFSDTISTVNNRTEFEYVTIMNSLLTVYGLNVQDFSGAIIASEVPSITDTVKSAVKRYLSLVPLIVGPGVKNGLNIRMDNPAQVGAGVIIDAVAGVSEYGAPLIIIDMGAATTISVIDKNKTFIGGMIMPGAGISLDALVDTTSQLPNIPLDAPPSVIGKNTIDSMKSGMIYGTAAGIDGMIDRVSAELGYEATIIATGKTAPTFISQCKNRIIYDETLPLKGLSHIYKKNCEKH